MLSAEDFMARPGLFASPSRVAAMIAPGLKPATVRMVFGSRAAAPRAHALLAAMLGGGDPARLEAEDLAMLLDAAKRRRVALAAGAVCQGRRVRALVRKPDIAALTEAIGEAARAAALRQAPPAGASPSDSGDLMADIEMDGALCVGAWAATLPGWAESRLRLMEALPELHDEGAGRAALVRTLSGEMPA